MECVDNVLADLVPLWKKRFGNEQHVFWIQHTGSQVLQAAYEVSQLPVDEQLSSGHCDLCPRRILMDALGFVRLKGVGFCWREDPERRQRREGGNHFEAPEVLEGSSLLPSLPCSPSSCSKRLSFSAGETLRAMLLCSENVEDAAMDLLDFQRKQPHYGHLLVDLISSLTKQEPWKRLDLLVAKRHPFFWSSEKCMAFITDVAATLQDEDAAARIEKMGHCGSL